MRVVFMGAPDFAIPALAALLDAGHEIAAVYTRPDRPTGRGRRLSPTPVKSAAVERGLVVRQPASLRSTADTSALRKLAPDVVVVAAFGLFLPRELLDAPPLGCLNIHPSLLPRHRGPSPVVAAILGGDESTGVTVMALDEGMDSGPMLAQRATSVGEDETAPELTRRLFEMGARLLVETLPRWASGEIAAAPQEQRQATYTPLVRKEDGQIDWTTDAARIARMVRAYEPWPGAYTAWNGRMLKILEAAPASGDMEQGLVAGLEDGRIVVGAGGGALRVSRLQLEGRRPTDARAFVLGYTSIIGARLG